MISREDELVELITEYLDTEGTKSQLLDILIKAIRYSDGVKDDDHEAVQPRKDCISKEGIFIEVDEENLNKIMEFRDLTKTETVSDAVMLAIKIATFTLTYTKKKENANDQQSE